MTPTPSFAERWSLEDARAYCVAAAAAPHFDILQEDVSHRWNEEHLGPHLTHLQNAFRATLAARAAAGEIQAIALPPEWEIPALQSWNCLANGDVARSGAITALLESPLLQAMFGAVNGKVEPATLHARIVRAVDSGTWPHHRLASLFSPHALEHASVQVEDWKLTVGKAPQGKFEPLFPLPAPARRAAP